MEYADPKARQVYAIAMSSLRDLATVPCADTFVWKSSCDLLEEIAGVHESLANLEAARSQMTMAEYEREKALMRAGYLRCLVSHGSRIRASHGEGGRELKTLIGDEVLHLLAGDSFFDNRPR